MVKERGRINSNKSHFSSISVKIIFFCLIDSAMYKAYRSAFLIDSIPFGIDLGILLYELNLS